MAHLPRKSDSRVRITIQDAAGAGIVISTLNDLNIYCYQKPKDIIQQWNKNAGEITTITDASGIVEVLLNRANTELLNFQLQDFFFEVAPVFTDADFEDGIRVEIDTNIVPTFNNEDVTAEDSQTAYQ